MGRIGIETRVSEAAWGRGIVLAGIVLMVAGRTAQAQFFWYEIQERTVKATLTDNPSVSHAAPDFGPWSSTAATSRSTGTQNSTLGGTSITVSAFAQGLAPGLPSGPDLMNFAWATSDLDVQFLLVQPLNYLIDGTVSTATQSPGDVAARVRLVNDAGAEVFAVSGGVGTQPINLGGLLPAGHYWLDMGLFAMGSNSIVGPRTAQASMDFTFSVTPEPASLALLVAGLSIVRRRPALHS